MLITQATTLQVQAERTQAVPRGELFDVDRLPSTA